MRIKKILLIGCISAAAVAVVVFLWLYGCFLPGWVTWNETEITADLCGDGNEEILTLKERQLTIRKQGEEDVILFTSPFLWRISDVFVQDLDGNGDKEIIMVVWKHGSYGKNRPFWVKKDTIAFSQHIFVFRYNGEKVSSVWMSSDLGRKAEIISFDENARLNITETDGKETVWEWDEWGFMLVEDEEKAPARVSLIAVGDNIAHESIVERAYSPEKGIFDFTNLYSEVKERISSYDIAVVNQETVLISEPDNRSGFPYFATPNTMGDALVDAGFDVILSASNHSYDYGTVGIEETVRFWREKHPEILMIGMYGENDDPSAIPVIEKNGIRMAFFNYTESTNEISLPPEYKGGVYLLKNKGIFLEDLKKAEEVCDLSLCFLHTGEEYSREPTTEQRELAEELIDAGADIIICSHPHVLQDYEKVTTENGNSAYVYWSLGNFMTGQTDPATIPGGAASIVIEKKEGEKAKVISYELLKVFRTEGRFPCPVFG